MNILRTSTLVVFVLLTVSVLQGQLKPVKRPAKLSSPAGTKSKSATQKLLIDQPLTSEMAEQANLNRDNPELSDNGFASQGAKDKDNATQSQLASAECLLAETVLVRGPDPSNPKPVLSDTEAASLCLNNRSAEELERYETQVESLDTGSTKAPTIDYALIHVVQWPTLKAAKTVTPVGTWYQFTRKQGQWTGVIALNHLKSQFFVQPLGVTAPTGLLGNKNVAVLALHVGIDNSCGISYDASASHTTPLSTSDFLDLVQFANSVMTAGSANTQLALKSLTPALSVALQQQPQLISSPKSLQLVVFHTGTTSTEAVSITNHSGHSVPISPTFVQKGELFSQTNNCGESLDDDATCTFTVTFSPKQGDTFDAKLKPSSANDTFEISIHGSVAQGLWGGAVIRAFDKMPVSLSINPTIVGTPTASGSNDLVTCQPSANQQRPDSAYNGGAKEAKSASPKGKLLKSASLELTSQASANAGGTSDTSSGDGAPAEQGATKGSGDKASSSSGNSNTTSGMSLTLLDEKPSVIDFSVALPMTTYKDIKYDSTNGVLKPKNTSKLNPFALADFYPRTDLNALTRAWTLAPKLAWGVAIGSRPLQNEYVGGGFNIALPWFHTEPMAGLIIQKQNRLNTGSNTATHTEWHAKLQFVLGFTVADATKLFKSASSSKSSGSSKTQTSNSSQ